MIRYPYHIFSFLLSLALVSPLSARIYSKNHSVKEPTKEPVVLAELLLKDKLFLDQGEVRIYLDKKASDLAKKQGKIFPLKEVSSLKVDFLPKIESPDKVEFRRIDAGMPHHNHGMTTKPEISQIEDGKSWKVDGMQLHMPGEWTFTLEFREKGKKEDSKLNFKIEI